MTTAPPNAAQADHPGFRMSRFEHKGGTLVQEEDLDEVVQGPIKIGGVAERGQPPVQEFVVDIRNATPEQTWEADQYARQVVGNSEKIEAKKKRAEARYRRLNEILMNQQAQAPQVWGQPYGMQTAPPPPANWGQQPQPGPGYPPNGPQPPQFAQQPYPQQPYQQYPQPPVLPAQPRMSQPPVPQPPTMPVIPQVVAPSHPVTFHFPGAGPMQFYYHKAEIQKSALVLSWDRRSAGGPSFLGDQLESPVNVQIAGYPGQYQVEATGLVLEIDNWIVSVLLITDSFQGN